MLKKIAITDLRPGMFVSDIDCSWRVEHLPLRQHRVDSEAGVDALRQLGVRELYIDVALGCDLPGAPTAAEVRLAVEAELVQLAAGECGLHRRLAEPQELALAREVHREASSVIHGIMDDVRLGRQVERAPVGAALAHISDTVLRNFDSLQQLGGIRSKDNYTFQHSVNVAALLGAFAQVLMLNKQTTRQLEMGGLLHDLGKMNVPDAILNKPGRLDPEEFAEIKRHVEYGQVILANADWFDTTARQVLGQHHERYDGSGYPQGLKGKEISMAGQMAAIVDVYDALTAERVYHQAMSAADALRKLQEWSRFHFNPELVAHFIRSVGIYPVHSLVALESGLLGIVIEQHPDELLRPRLLLVYDARKEQALNPRYLDLAGGTADRIVQCVRPGDYGLDIEACLGALPA